MIDQQQELILSALIIGPETTQSLYSVQQQELEKAVHDLSVQNLQNILKKGYLAMALLNDQEIQNIQDVQNMTGLQYDMVNRFSEINRSINDKCQELKDLLEKKEGSENDQNYKKEEQRGNQNSFDFSFKDKYQQLGFQDDNLANQKPKQIDLQQELKNEKQEPEVKDEIEDGSSDTIEVIVQSQQAGSQEQHKQKEQKEIKAQIKEDVSQCQIHLSETESEFQQDEHMITINTQSSEEQKDGKNIIKKKQKSQIRKRLKKNNQDNQTIKRKKLKENQTEVYQKGSKKQKTSPKQSSNQPLKGKQEQDISYEDNIGINKQRLWCQCCQVKFDNNREQEKHTKTKDHNKNYNIYLQHLELLKYNRRAMNRSEKQQDSKISHKKNQAQRQEKERQKHEKQQSENQKENKLEKKQLSNSNSFTSEPSNNQFQSSSSQVVQYNLTNETESRENHINLNQEFQNNIMEIEEIQTKTEEPQPSNQDCQIDVPIEEIQMNNQDFQEKTLESPLLQNELSSKYFSQENDKKLEQSLVLENQQQENSTKKPQFFECKVCYKQYSKISQYAAHYKTHNNKETEQQQQIQKSSENENQID